MTMHVERKAKDHQDTEGVPHVVHRLALQDLANALLREAQASRHAAVLDLHALSQQVHVAARNAGRLQQVGFRKVLREVLSLQALCTGHQHHRFLATLGGLSVHAFEAGTKHLQEAVL